MSIGVIIQARTGSKRLPQKILLELPFHSGVTVLENIIARARRISSVDRIIVATSTEPEDDAVETLCRRSRALCFRGALDNVLDRFYHAALAHRLTTIIRLTADNPCYDYGLIEGALRAHLDHGSDYTVTQNNPLGTDVEVFSFKALERSFQKASCPFEREHVTPYIYQTAPEEFDIRTVPSPAGHGDLRLTLDTERDYVLQCAIYDSLYSSNPFFGIADIIGLLEKKPWLKKINEQTYQKRTFNNLEEEIIEAMRILESNELTNARDGLAQWLRNGVRVIPT